MRLFVSIYTDGSDCTNGGLSARVDRGYLIWDETIEEFNKNPILNEAVFILEKGLGGRKFMAKPLGDKRWLSFGGNFLYTCDSRFPSDQPIHIHDRYEP